jgi:O-antigen ligase
MQMRANPSYITGLNRGIALVISFLMACIVFVPQPVINRSAMPLNIFLLSGFLFYTFAAGKPFLKAVKDADAADIALFIFLAIVSVSLFYSRDIDIAGKRYALTYLPVIFIYMISKSQSKDISLTAVKLICLAGLAMSVFMVLAALLDISLTFQNLFSSRYYRYASYPSYAGRAFGVFYHPTITGAFLTMVLPFAALFLSDRKNKISFAFGCALFIFVSAAIYLTFSKMAWLIACCIFLWYLRAVKAGIKNLILTSALIMAAIFLVKYDVFRKQFGPDLIVTAVSYRLQSFVMAINMALDHPFAGAGLDHFRLLYLEYNHDASVPGGLRIPDNMYLTILAETGIAAVLSFIAFAVFLIRKAIKKIKNMPLGPDKIFTEAALISIAGALMHSTSYDSFYWCAPLVMFWMLAGILSGLVKNLDGKRT